MYEVAPLTVCHRRGGQGEARPYPLWRPLAILAILDRK